MVKIALLQMEPKEKDLEYNRRRAAEMIDEAISSDKDTELIVLPETWTSPFNVRENLMEQVEKYGETEDGPAIRMLRERAKRYQVWIVAGSIPVKLKKHQDDRYRNMTFLIDPSGEIVSDYSKIHLCEWVGENIPFANGNEIKKPYRTELGTLGLIICYDIRFPELIRALALQGTELLIVPAYFSTSLHHWTTLLQARAIENQMFVIGCNCSGEGSVGHSMVIDPMGNIVAKADNTEQIVYADINLTCIEKARKEVKYLDDRQPSTYSKRMVE